MFFVYRCYINSYILYKYVYIDSYVPITILKIYVISKMKNFEIAQFNLQYDIFLIFFPVEYNKQKNVTL